MNVIYFDKNVKFKKEFIEYVYSETNNLFIQEVRNEKELLSAVKIGKAEIILIDLYSIEIDTVKKIKKIKQYSGERTLIILTPDFNRIMIRYFLEAGATICINKNDELHKLIEILKAGKPKTSK